MTTTRSSANWLRRTGRGDRWFRSALLSVVSVGVSLLAPIAVVPAAAVVESYRAIAAGGNHTCAITTTDRPVCWGDNEYGQRTVPAGLGTVHSITAGSYHTCAITSDGTPVCWGQNLWRQTAVPAGIGTVRQMDAGHAHTCAVKTDDTPVCWGAYVPDGEPNASPIQVTIPPGVVGVKQISAGHQHTCVVKTDGTPLCWGGGHFSLPWLPSFDRNTFVPIPPGIGTVLEISAGRGHTCVIKSNATAECWGGLLGDPASVPGDLGTADLISSGWFHTCAIKSGPDDGTPVCWGATGAFNSGQATIPADLGPVYTISAGLFHTCAIRFDNAAVCWGSNQYGQSTVPGVRQDAPVATAKPVITGTPTIGSTLTVSTGAWDNSPTEYAYSWHRCAGPEGIWACIGGAIPGADQPSYTVVTRDAKLYLRVLVTATNASGSMWQLSDAVEIRPGISLPAVVRGSTTWLARDSLTSGDATTTFNYGAKPLVPIMGDWDGDGSETPGTFEGGVFKMSNTMGGPATITVRFGDPRGFPVIGDFNGDRFDDLAVYRAGAWEFRLELGGVGMSGYIAETPRILFGSGSWPSTIPVAGDWDGIVGDGIGFYTPATGAWQLRQIPDGVDLPPFTYWAGSGSYPVVGDWNADGIDTVGVRSGSSWQLNNQNDGSGPEITFSLGLSNDLPLSWKRPAPPPA